MGWSAQYFTTIIIEGSTPQTGIFIYGGAPGSGNLIGSWAAAAGTDAFGNSYPAGINVFQGQLTGVSLNSGTINAGTILAAALTNCSFTGGTLSNTQISQSTYIMNSSGGVIYAYATTTTTDTFNTAGSPTFTSTVTGTASVSCWGSGAGGGGGGAGGGESGGAGEWSNEPAYPLVNDYVYTMSIPAGGTGGQTGSGGSNGSQCVFDTQQLSGPSVIAGGGEALYNYQGGPGGNISTNTNHFPGGNGSNGDLGTGGASGANSGCPTAAGTSANINTGSGTETAPAAQTGGGRGGNGGANNGNGTSGSVPGGSGGGAGASSGGSNAFNETWKCSATYAYNGTDVSGPTYLENTNGNMLQGNPDVGEGNYPGNQYSFAYFSNHASIASALSGVAISKVTVTLDNEHSWYDGGMYVVLGWHTRTSFPNSNVGPGGNNNKTQYWIDQGHALTQDITNLGFGTAFQSGGATGFVLGPATPSNSDPSLYDYGYFKGGANNVILNIVGTTGGGGGINTAGNGANGQCMVTYSTTSALIGAISPVAGTDANGNAYAAGFTGNITAIQPASSPAVLETPHIVSYANSWTKVSAGLDLEYILLGTNTVHISGRITNAGTPSNPSTICTLPTGYLPARQQAINVVENPASPYTGIAHILLVNTNGIVALYGAFTAGNTLNINGVYSLV